MDASIIVAIGSFIAAIGGIVIALVTNVTGAKKAELESLRATITTLTAENVRLRDRVGELEKENEALRCEVDRMWENVNAKRAGGKREA